MKRHKMAIITIIIRSLIDIITLAFVKKKKKKKIKSYISYPTFIPTYSYNFHTVDIKNVENIANSRKYQNGR